MSTDEPRENDGAFLLTKKGLLGSILVAEHGFSFVDAEAAVEAICARAGDGSYGRAADELWMPPAIRSAARRADAECD